MGFLTALQDAVAKIADFFFGKKPEAAPPVERAATPLADRLLADAVRFTELASPTEREERRATFIVERLASLGIASSVDEDGNVLIRLNMEDAPDACPVLFFTDLGTSHWNPLGSLVRVDPDTARGAALADSLGPAALISLAESVVDGSIVCTRDLIFLFAARALDDPRSGVFERLSEDPRNRPIAAIGVRGFSLGAVCERPLGIYRLDVRVRTSDAPVAVGAATAASGAAGSSGGPTVGAAAAIAPIVEAPSAVDAAVAVARRLSGVRWDAAGATVCRIRRIEAGIGFGRVPTEGLVEIELESGDAAVLDLAMKAAVATAETAGRESGAKTTVSVAGYVPVGWSRSSEKLLDVVKARMKELGIKVRSEVGADPAAFLSVHGIPAGSVGVALGREGLESDEVDIASIEDGRRLLASLAAKL